MFIVETDRYNFFETDTDIFKIKIHQYLAICRYFDHRYRYSKICFPIYFYKG